MLTTADISPDFLTIYLDIPKGENINVSTLGRSLVEFEKMAREVAARTDPFVKFELGFERSEEGSLRLITNLKDRISTDRLKEIAWAIIIALVVQPAVGIVSEDTWRSIMEKIGYPHQEMSDEDVERMKKIVIDAMNDSEVKHARNNLYQTLDADPIVNGIGAKPDSSPGKPFLVVPKGNFAKMGIPDAPEIEADAVPRIVSSETLLVLERPVLRKASKAVWDFRLGGHKISARVEDQDFIDGALSGKLSIPLIEGVELNVILEDNQEFNAGAWHHKSYTVRKVIEWNSPADRPSLPITQSSQDGDDNH